MKKITISALITFLLASTFATANEVNIFNARHYKADGGFIVNLPTWLE